MVRLASIAVAGLLLIGCGGGGGPSPSGPLLPEDRLALPQYDLARYRTLITELRGRPVVVNIWGSWCPPCRSEAPGLAAVSAEYLGRVQFLGVDILDERGSAREFIREFGWIYPSIFDPRGEIRDGLGYIGQPVTIVYDAAGEVAFERVGEISAEMLREQIEKVL